MIRVGIAGLGFMGMVHYLTYLRRRDVKVAAICETSARRLAGDWRDIKGNFGPSGTKMDLSGVSTYDSLPKLLADKSLDLIDVTLPPALHAEVAIEALQNGKHVFCEKPMSLSLRECEQMLHAAKTARKLLLIGHVLPFFPEYRWALEVVRSGKYGKLLGGNFKRVISDPAWLKSYWVADKVGGPMLDLHVHDAHFIRLLFGMPTAVHTCGRQRGDVAEYWHTHFFYGKPSYIVQATSGTIQQQGRAFDHGFEIHLEQATIAFEFAVIGDNGRYLCPPTIFDKRGRSRAVKLSGGDPMDAFKEELKEVAKCVRKNTPSVVLDGQISRDAIQLCTAQTTSLHQQRTIEV